MTINPIDRCYSHIIEGIPFPNADEMSQFTTLLASFPCLPQYPSLYTPAEIAAVLGYDEICLGYSLFSNCGVRQEASGLSPLFLAFIFNRQKLFTELFFRCGKADHQEIENQLNLIATHFEPLPPYPSIPESDHMNHLMGKWLQFAPCINSDLASFLFNQADPVTQVCVLSHHFKTSAFSSNLLVSCT